MPIGEMARRAAGTDKAKNSIVLGLLAGCQFFGGYPITPSTEVMQLFTREIRKYGGAALQAGTPCGGDRRRGLRLS